jgi:hypothetical protein
MSMTRLPLTICFFYGYHWCGFFSCIVICCAVIDFDRSFGTFFLSDIYMLVKCYIIKVDRLFYLSTYFGF